jgi:GTPase SAR1 family protein
MTFVDVAVNPRPKDETALKIIILGPDGAGKSSVIQGLIGKLEAEGRKVRMRHLKPRLVVRSGDSVIHRHRPAWQAASIRAGFSCEDIGLAYRGVVREALPG